jgi:hypothetical protein
MAAYQRKDPNLILFILITVLAKESGAVKILLKYRDFQHLFEEAKGKKTLLKYRPWDYEISIIDGRASGV